MNRQEASLRRDPAPLSIWLFLLHCLWNPIHSSEKCVTGDGREIGYPKYYNRETGEFEFSDPHAAHLENGGGALVNQLSGPMQEKIRCFQGLISDLHGSSSITSAYRPFQYQDHFYNINTTYKELKRISQSKESNSVCKDIFRIVDKERSSHGFKAVDRPNRGNHVKKMAFDLKWNLPGIQKLSSGRVLTAYDHYIDSEVELHDPDWWVCSAMFCYYDYPRITRVKRYWPTLMECPSGPFTFVDLDWSPVPCESNPDMVNFMGRSWEMARELYKIDNLAAKCGLWRAKFKHNKKEWMHFECISPSSCQVE